MSSRPTKRVAAILVALGLAGFVFGYLGCWPPFATVMSGSMSPTIKTGDVVVLKRMHGLPKVGDIIAVSVPERARSRYGYPPVVTHRVVRVTADGTISTKGDARPAPDPFTIHRSAVTAKVVTHIPAAGHVMAFLMSPMGLLWIAGGVAMFVVIPLLERRQEAERAEQDQLAAVRAELHTITEELTRLRVDPAPQDPVQVEAAPAEEEPMPFVAAPTVDWLDLETEDESQLEPHWPEPPEFLPSYVAVGREAAPPEHAETEPEAEAAPELEPVTYVVRRRSGGLLARLR
jgi:signal peptidase I